MLFVSSSKKLKLLLLILPIIVSKRRFLLLLLSVKQLMPKLKPLLPKLLLKLLLYPLVKRRIDSSKHFWRLFCSCCSCCLEWDIAQREQAGREDFSIGKHHVVVLILD